MIVNFLSEKYGPILLSPLVCVRLNSVSFVAARRQASSLFVSEVSSRLGGKYSGGMEGAFLSPLIQRLAIDSCPARALHLKSVSSPLALLFISVHSCLSPPFFISCPLFLQYIFLSAEFCAKEIKYLEGSQRYIRKCRDLRGSPHQRDLQRPAVGPLTRPTRCPRADAKSCPNS